LHNNLVWNWKLTIIFSQVERQRRQQRELEEKLAEMRIDVATGLNEVTGLATSKLFSITFQIIPEIPGQEYLKPASVYEERCVYGS
jgi:hypothetical protein